ncbi:substrate-binding domain-containing protein [Parasphingopyxis marina]|uniref:4,5-dihydroxyphthalate decarboxylase n=1 Tax=Parasphingopyxis marina TaxID=2761622 RepID=A0A842I126_9SPHN|nr:hypothetical protein [Parasphingopyxis marina]MBC2778922.1 hypothetical protein [Parasphingopyxis marina]
MTGLPLTVALSANAYTRPVVGGEVAIRGAAPEFTVLHPSEMFYRQLHFAEFDVSEMSVASLIIAHASGDRQWLALPIFTMRQVFHTGILVHRDSGIAVPKDLEGKRVAVPEYQQTSAIWSRGILAEDLGVDLTSIDWFMERGPERSHGSATGFAPPPGIRLQTIAPETNIGEMLVAGELDATLLYLNAPNLVDRSSIDVSEVARPLFPDPEAESRRYVAETGIMPLNHCLVVRRSLAETRAWLPGVLTDAFLEARLRAKGDPIAPYGLAPNRAVLERLARYIHGQGLIERPVDIEDIFAAEPALASAPGAA